MLHLVEWLVGFAVIWVICALIGTAIGSSKGRGGEGFLLGLLLGVFGVIIVAVMPPSRAVQALRDEALATAIGSAMGTAAPPQSSPLDRQRFIAEALRRDPSLGDSDDTESLKRLAAAAAEVEEEFRTRADLEAVREAEEEAEQEAEEERRRAEARAQEAEDAARETERRRIERLNEAEREASFNPIHRWMVRHRIASSVVGLALVLATGAVALGVNDALQANAQRDRADQKAQAEQADASQREQQAEALAAQIDEASSTAEGFMRSLGCPQPESHGGTVYCDGLVARTRAWFDSMAEAPESLPQYRFRTEESVTSEACAESSGSSATVVLGVGWRLITTEPAVAQAAVEAGGQRALCPSSESVLGAAMSPDDCFNYGVHWATSGDVGPTRLALLATCEDPAIRRAVAGNGATPIATLEMLAKDRVAAVRSAVFASQDFRRGYRTLVAAALSDPSNRVRSEAARTTDNATVLRRLSLDPSTRVRMAVATNAQASPSTLRRLIRDSSQAVAVRAAVTAREHEAYETGYWDVRFEYCDKYASRAERIQPSVAYVCEGLP